MKDKTKHTPGPWKRLPIQGDCNISTPDFLLMRAAPDLLRSLRTWLEFAQEELREFDELCDAEDTADLCPKCRNVGCIRMKIQEAREAIAKATGTKIEPEVAK